MNQPEQRPWRLAEPRFSRTRLMIRWIIWAGLTLVAVTIGMYELSNIPPRPRTVNQRWRKIVDGDAEWLELVILGDVPWQPPAFDANRPIRVTREGAQTGIAGLESTTRRIPLPELNFLALHPPGDAAHGFLDVVRPEDWTVAVIHGSSGKRSGFTGDLPSLALLAGVAGWAEPPNLP